MNARKDAKTQRQRRVAMPMKRTVAPPFPLAPVRAYLVEVAKQEMQEWRMPDGVVMAILFCYVERVITGKRIEELYRWAETSDDYEI